jgi:hypothetical protein
MLLIREVHESLHQFMLFLFTGEFGIRDLIFWTTQIELNNFERAFVYLIPSLFNLICLSISYAIINKNKLALVFLLASNPFSQLYALVLKGGDIWHATQNFQIGFNFFIPILCFVLYMVPLYLLFRYKKNNLMISLGVIVILLLVLPFVENILLKYVLNPFIKWCIIYTKQSLLTITLYNVTLVALFVLLLRMDKKNEK